MRAAASARQSATRAQRRGGTPRSGALCPLRGSRARSSRGVPPLRAPGRLRAQGWRVLATTARRAVRTGVSGAPDRGEAAREPRGAEDSSRRVPHPAKRPQRQRTPALLQGEYERLGGPSGAIARRNPFQRVGSVRGFGYRGSSRACAGGSARAAALRDHRWGRRDLPVLDRRQPRQRGAALGAEAVVARGHVAAGGAGADTGIGRGHQSAKLPAGRATARDGRDPATSRHVPLRPLTRRRAGRIIGPV